MSVETVKVQFTRNCCDDLGTHVLNSTLDVTPARAEGYYGVDWAKPYVEPAPKPAETYNPPVDHTAPKVKTETGGGSTTAPAEGTPDEGTPDEGTPDEGTPDEGTPDEGTPDEGPTPKDDTPGE